MTKNLQEKMAKKSIKKKNGEEDGQNRQKQAKKNQ